MSAKKKPKKKSGASAGQWQPAELAGYGFYGLAIVLSGLAFSFSLGPVSSGWAGLASLVLFMLLARYLYSSSVWLMLFTGWLLSLSFQLFAFFWIPGTIQFYAGTTREAATIYALVYSVVYQLRVFLLFAGFWLSFRYGRKGILLVPLAALIGDGFAPQVFNWYWGNLTEGWLLWSQTAALGGVYLSGALLALLVRLLYEVVAEALQFLDPSSEARRSAGLIAQIKQWMAEPSLFKPVSRESSANEVKKLVPGSGKVRFSTTIVTSALIALMLAHGFWNLYRVDQALATGKDRGFLKVAMLQTATSKKMLGSLSDYEHAASAMNRVINQSLEVIHKSGASLDLIILPESAIPYHGIAPGQKGYSVTMHSLLSFIYGTARSSFLFNQLQREDELTYNTATLMDPGHSIQQHYRKRVLIPYGEYLPFEDTFPFLRKIFPGAGRYRPEAREQNLTMKMTYYPDRPRLPLVTAREAGIQDPEALWANPGDSLRAGERIYSQSLGQANNDEDPFDNSVARTLEFALLICYEDLIPELAISSFQESPPDFIVNISNDSWLADERAMQQHFGAARFRAIETGRFLLRSTLTGISGIMDPAGRDFVEPTAVDTRGTLLERVPVQGHVNTLYATLGPWALRILLLINLAGLLFTLVITGSIQFRKETRQK
ncbi:MAG: hypothetical protein CMN76_05690 [Spirochaetaceae bacterium]|nr:hypothetical protein [Spirochaetaceae bacterium]